MSENRISNSHELNNTDHTTGKNNYNAISNNGSPEFKTVGNSKKGFLEKTLSDRKSDIEKFIENNQVLKLTKKSNLNGDEKEQKPCIKPAIEVKISNKQKPIGNGSFGVVYDAKVAQLGNVDQDKAENEIEYAVKIPKKTNDSKSDPLNDIKKSQLLIREMVNFTKKTDSCATLQTLELMVPVLGRVNVILSSGKKQDAMLMMKVDGKDGFDAIFGYKVQKPDGKEEYIEPIEGYNVKVCVDGGEYHCVADPKISLDIAFQKIFALRGLHDLGLVYGDVKIENVKIKKENDKYIVRLIDIGSITKKDKNDCFTLSPLTAAPEGFVGGKRIGKYIPDPKFDVFANAVDLPYIFFGGVAKKHLQSCYKLEESSPRKIVASFNRIKNKAFHFKKWGWFKTLFMYIFQNDTYTKYVNDEKDYLSKLEESKVFAEREYFQDRLFLGDIFSAYEYADSDDVEEMLKEYEQNGFERPDFSSPNFPKNMTNAQKMRYMHWHLGFLKTNKDIESGTGKNGEKGKGVYPIEVIHSLSLLQMYSTDPDPKKRISSRVVERVLLHLKMTVDQWENRQYRIKGMDDDLSKNEQKMVDIILPKNEANKKNKN